MLDVLFFQTLLITFMCFGTKLTIIHVACDLLPWFCNLLNLYLFFSI